MKKNLFFISILFFIPYFSFAMEYFEDMRQPYTFHDISPLNLGKHIALRAIPAAAVLLIYSPLYSKNYRSGIKVVGYGGSLVAAYSAWTFHTIVAIRGQHTLEKVKNNPLTALVLTYNHNKSIANNIDHEDIFLQENRENTLKAFSGKYKDKKFPLNAALVDLEKLKKQAENAQSLFANSSHYSYYFRIDSTDPSGRKDRLCKLAKNLYLQILQVQELLQKSDEWEKEQQSAKTLSSKIWRFVEANI